MLLPLRGRFPITDLSPAEWQQAISVNITGLFKRDTRSTCGDVLAVDASSISRRLLRTSALRGGRVAYSTTKGAVLAFTRKF